MRSHAAYAHAPYSESSALAILEAMAAGLPILAGAANAAMRRFRGEFDAEIIAPCVGDADSQTSLAG